MEPVDGFNATVGLPTLHASDPAIRRRMGLALIEGIAALGRLDHVKVGLSRLGNRRTFWCGKSSAGGRSLKPPEI